MEDVVRDRRRWFAAGAVALGGAIVREYLGQQRERRRLLRRGEVVELESVWTEVDGCRMHGRLSTAAGNRENLPVVLVHGWGISGSYFIPTAERLASTFTVYLPDLPGHGRSATPPKPLDIPALARSVLGWMEAHGIDRASLVSHSMGCLVAVEAALQSPARVDRLVLIGMNPDPVARTFPKQFTRFVRSALFERYSLGLHVARDYARMGVRTVPEFRFMLEDRVEDKLPQLTVPTMLVRGEKDSLAPQSWIEEAARLLRTKEIAAIPGWGHAVQYSAPKELVETIRPFLREALSIA